MQGFILNLIFQCIGLGDHQGLFFAGFLLVMDRFTGGDNMGDLFFIAVNNHLVGINFHTALLHDDGTCVGGGAFGFIALGGVRFNTDGLGAIAPAPTPAHSTAAGR